MDRVRLDRIRLGRLDHEALIDTVLRLDAQVAQLEAEVAALRVAVPPSVPARSVLSERQQEIVALIAEGLSNAEIAARLDLTPGTVANHVGYIMKRIGAFRRVEVAAWAVRRGVA